MYALLADKPAPNQMSQLTFNLMPERRTLTVSELTARLRDLLVKNFTDILVEGEISNCRAAQSGHFYFTLKDDKAQVRCVWFKQQMGGAKIRREREGLLDAKHKKPLPVLPSRIGLITSPTGAAVRDVVRILRRRFPNVCLALFPVRVQGEGAALEIVKAIEFFNLQKTVDVLIVGRGGGSMEDLWAFNEEIVARAIFESKIPVISGVGHETDFTIADFAADVRASTPSAAAEIVVQRRRGVDKAG